MDYKKYYVVWNGRKTGVFNTWNECKKQVDGFKGAKFKSFIGRENAEKEFRKIFVNSDKNTLDDPKKTELVPKAKIYSDGAANPNPGKGGFGVIVDIDGKIREYKRGFFFTTNNRMELMGVIFGLERMKQPSVVTVYSDSKYIINGINMGWAKKWKSNNWMRDGLAVPNCDLWDRLLLLIEQNKMVNFQWIKGHAGHKYNEKCDVLAKLASENEHSMKEDFAYEHQLFRNSIGI